MESLALFLKWFEVPILISLSNYHDHPCCTYDLAFCGLPFKVSKYISKSAKEAKLDFGCHADQ